MPPAGEPPVSAIGAQFTHIEPNEANVGVGDWFTVIVNVCGEPTHPFKVGVTVTLAIPVPEGVNEAILPVPEAARPMPVLLLVHAYVEEVLEPLKLMACVDDPEQNVLAPGFVTVGGGVTVAVTATRADVQPPELVSA